MYIYDSIVIGEGIYGLYVGIKCLTQGQKTVIIEKKSILEQEMKSEELFTIFPENNKLIINLLKMYNIEYEIYYISKNEKSVLNDIVYISKSMSSTILTYMSFETLLAKHINKEELQTFRKNSIFYYQLKQMNSIDAVKYIETTILKNVLFTYYKQAKDLLTRLREHYLLLGGKILYQTYITNVNKIYNMSFISVIGLKIHYKCKILFSTLKKENVLSIIRWQYNKQILFNSISNSKNMQKEYQTKKCVGYMLSKYNLSLPTLKDIDTKDTYVWKVGINSQDVYDKLRNPENNIYLCNDIYSKHQGMLYGGIELIEDNFSTLSFNSLILSINNATKFA